MDFGKGETIMSEKISPAVIRRLPRYYRYLEELEGKGMDKISSSQMSLEMGLNASHTVTAYKN